jgi:hypothetical protein
VYDFTTRTFVPRTGAAAVPAHSTAITLASMRRSLPDLFSWKMNLGVTAVMVLSFFGKRYWNNRLGRQLDTMLRPHLNSHPLIRAAVCSPTSGAKVRLMRTHASFGKQTVTAGTSTRQGAAHLKDDPSQVTHHFSIEGDKGRKVTARVNLLAIYNKLNPTIVDRWMITNTALKKQGSMTFTSIQGMPTFLEVAKK